MLLHFKLLLTLYFSLPLAITYILVLLHSHIFFPILAENNYVLNTNIRALTGTYTQC